MKVRTDGDNIMFTLKSEKEIDLTWQELADLEKLIKVLRSITDQHTPQSLLLRF